MSERVMISLTTIPPRFAKLGPTLASLCNQRLDVDEIVLWIPRSYHWRHYDAIALPKVPAGVIVRECDDYGPATKLLPALRAAGSEDMLIIYCDDDKLYQPDWASRLTEAAIRFPSRAFAWAGCGIDEIYDRHLRRNGPSALATKLSLGLLQPLKWRRPHMGPIDIAFGYGGVAVRPRFFRPDVFDIPQGCLVDDIWISGQLRVSGTRIDKLPGPIALRNRRSAEIAPLKQLKQDDIDRASADFSMACYLRERYKIWTEYELIE